MARLFGRSVREDRPAKLLRQFFGPQLRTMQHA